MNKPRKDYGLIIAILLLILGLLSIFIPFKVFDGIGIGNYEINIGKYNELGEFISGITSPFLSIAAFILLYLTYSSQKKELKENKEILINQNQLITIQQFETTFFNLLDGLNKIVSQIETLTIIRKTTTNGTTEDRRVKNGKHCFSDLYESFRHTYMVLRKNNANLKETIDTGSNDLIDAVYFEFYKSNEADLGHYFRFMYQVVKFVDQSALTNKQDYIDILRAQLSTYELILLFINCLSRYGEKFKPLVEKYSMLKNIADNDELLSFACRDLYDKKAFGEE